LAVGGTALLAKGTWVAAQTGTAPWPNRQIRLIVNFPVGGSPDAIARGLVDFQRREFGFQLVSATEFVQKEYGRIVDRAERNLQEVARGVPPSIAECRAVP
jgi:hypothetical protein